MNAVTQQWYGLFFARMHGLTRFIHSEQHDDSDLDHELELNGNAGCRQRLHTAHTTVLSGIAMYLYVLPGD